MSSSALNIRPMVRSEVDLLVEWAAQEGWNPGLYDAEVFWKTDPSGFLAAEHQGELIGGGATISYEGEFGFMGFFMVRPEFRGKGFGNTLWHARLAYLKGRLRPGASIGMDGVYAMQAYYAKGGFVFSHRDIRFRGEFPEGISLASSSKIVCIPLAEILFSELLAFDRRCFPAERAVFLKQWIKMPGCLVLGAQQEGDFVGYGVVRPCREGFKIGPLFAESFEVARALLERFILFARGKTLFLDVPENNPEALFLARSFGMKDVFGCARMYLGDQPLLQHHCVFGVTTFEVG